MDRTRTGNALISERALHHWADTGRRDVRAELTRALKEFSDHEGTAADSTLARMLYELLWIVLQAKLARQEALALLKDAELTTQPKACDLLTDLLWVVGNEVEANERGRERHTSREWRALCQLVKAVADEKLVTPLSLKASLEFDLLHDADLAPEPQALAKKVVRINTKTLYTQTKYNLLREETEGFAKVLGLLHTGVTKRQLAATSTDLLALIGFFDLDANRVLDLVLDAYERHPRNDCFAQLLGAFKRESLPHILGFKFQFYKRDPPAVEGVTTPRSLYRLAATLLDKNLLELEALMPHLGPSRDEIVSKSLARTKEMKEQARAFGKVSLAGKKDSDKGDADDEAASAAAKCQRDAAHNQVYGLIIGLLEIGAQQRAFEMIAWFQDKNVNPLTFTPLTTQLCAVVNVMVDAVYAPLSSRSLQLVGKVDKSETTLKKKSSPSQQTTENRYIRPVATFEECVSTVFPIVEMLGPQLHHDQFLFMKLLRIVGKMLEDQLKKPKATSEGGSGKEEDPVVQTIKSLVVKTFLPALSLQSCDPSTAFMLWDLLKAFPCDERYRMYLQWLEAYLTYPELQLREAEVVQSTRAVMRRLTADRAKLSARSLTHVAHSNPLIVFRTMLRQIQSYDNLIQPVVESFKFVTPLGMDVLSFVLVSELSKPQKSMKADGTHVSLWLTSLANFSGSFYRRYPNVELAGLLQYLIQRLQNWASVDLVVLSELLTKMGSCLSLEDISVSQLEAQAGGPHLWYEPSDPKFTNRRAIPRLRDALIKRNLALPLCILICQMRSRIEFFEDKELPHLKLLGRVYDTCQLTLSQLLQFLNGVVDPLVYRKMLPSITTLVREYHVPAELAMTLCRPAMRSDDPILQSAPRGIHAPGGGNTASNGTGRTTTNGAATNDTLTGEKHWYMYSPEVLEDVGRALHAGDGPDANPKDPFTGISREMYVTFWTLTLYDIHIPFQQYESEILRLRNSVSSASNAALAAGERKKLKEKTAQMIDTLTTEQKDQVAHRKRVYERLEEMKSKFFASEPLERLTGINELLQKCVVPRALLSPEDALFTAKFLERLHLLTTPQFSTLQYIDKVNMQLSAVVLCATEREAGNFGIFLKETLGLILRWYQSGGTYDEEAVHGKIGFSVDLNDGKKALAHRQFKVAYAKWHRQLELVYTTALASGEYMQIRNTLVVLTKLIDVFPSGRGTAEVLLDIVEKLTNEDREDIKIMAKRYFALLTKRKASLVDDKLLRPRRERDVASKSATSATTAPSSSDHKKEEAEAANEKQSNDKSDKQDDDTRDGVKKAKLPLSRADSQPEVESGEIVNESSSATSSRLKRRDAERERGGDRERGGRGGRGNGALDSSRDHRSSEERRGRRDHRDRDASPPAAKATGRSSSTSSRTTEKGGVRERSGSASRKHERSSPAPRRSLSGDGRGDDRGNSSDSRRSSRDQERVRERERGGRGERDANAPHNSRSRSRERQERRGRSHASVHGREEGDTEDALKKPESSKASPATTTSPIKSEKESMKPTQAAKPDREPLKPEPSIPEGVRKRARPTELSEAALRRQLTAEKKSQDQRKPLRENAPEEPPAERERGEQERMRPTGRDRVRPPLSAPTSTSPAAKASPTAADTPTSTGGVARKIVSLVSSSRKREREPVAAESDVVGGGGNGPEGKRQRDGGVGGTEQKRVHEDKRNKRQGGKNKGGGGDGGVGNGGNQQQRDQMRGRQERGGGGGGRNGDRRGGHEERGGGGGGGGRRRDRNDNRGGRR